MTHDAATPRRAAADVRQVPAGRPRTRAVRLLVGFFELMLAARQRAVQRHAMAMLDDHMLRDIGLRRTDLHVGITRQVRHY